MTRLRSVILFILVCVVAAAPAAAVHVIGTYAAYEPIIPLLGRWAHVTLFGGALIVILMALPSSLFLSAAARRGWRPGFAYPAFGAAAALAWRMVLQSLGIFAEFSAAQMLFDLSLIAGGAAAGWVFAIASTSRTRRAAKPLRRARG
ncbi:MAG: hypothetical protein AAGM38_04840 [Pseudomonadota bacterium]